jgi:hypothetical protein
MTHIVIVSSLPARGRRQSSRRLALTTIVGIAGGFGHICPSCAAAVVDRLELPATEPMEPYAACWARCDAARLTSIEVRLRSRPLVSRP